MPWDEEEGTAAFCERARGVVATAAGAAEAEDDDDEDEEEALDCEGAGEADDDDDDDGAVAERPLRTPPKALHHEVPPASPVSAGGTVSCIGLLASPANSVDARRDLGGITLGGQTRRKRGGRGNGGGEEGEKVVPPRTCSWMPPNIRKQCTTHLRARCRQALLTPRRDDTRGNTSKPHHDDVAHPTLAAAQAAQPRKASCCTSNTHKWCALPRHEHAHSQQRSATAPQRDDGRDDTPQPRHCRGRHLPLTSAWSATQAEARSKNKGTISKKLNLIAQHTAARATRRP